METSILLLFIVSLLIVYYDWCRSSWRIRLIFCIVQVSWWDGRIWQLSVPDRSCVPYTRRVQCVCVAYLNECIGLCLSIFKPASFSLFYFGSCRAHVIRIMCVQCVFFARSLSLTVHSFSLSFLLSNVYQLACYCATPCRNASANYYFTNENLEMLFSNIIAQNPHLIIQYLALIRSHTTTLNVINKQGPNILANYFRFV